MTTFFYLVDFILFTIFFGSFLVSLPETFPKIKPLIAHPKPHEA